MCEGLADLEGNCRVWVGLADLEGNCRVGMGLVGLGRGL